jgi:hypothetical protein
LSKTEVVFCFFGAVQVRATVCNFGPCLSLQVFAAGCN